jgi:mono/diheme cytochrome c family protein
MTPPSAFLFSVTSAALTLVAVFSLEQRVSAQTYIPTYYVDVQPILGKNCVTCHITGGIAPFALDNPADAVQWATRIAEVTRSEYMPPWPPARDSAAFFNERRLGGASKQVLADWAKAGAPLGKPPKK